MSERFDVDIIELALPERFWMATRTDMLWLVDPDVQDGKQRHSDRDSIRWQQLAAIFTEVSNALTSGQHVPSAEVSHTVEVAVHSCPTDGLTEAELDVVDAAWTYAEAPRADPWSDQLTNGRHRLWNLWKHAPEAIIPIRSDLLDYVDDIPTMGEKFAGIIRASASNGLKSLSETLIKRSPLYRSQLLQATTVAAP